MRAILVVLLAGVVMAAAAQPAPVVTVVADFEDDSVAARIGAVQNVPLADCAVRPEMIPARGQRCLAMQIGATIPNAAATCELRFRVPTRFAQVERLAAFYWLKSDQAALSFLVRDALGQEFETRPQKIGEHNRWVRIATDFAADQLTRVGGTAALQWPIEVAGVRVSTPNVGRQFIYIDELQVEHRVPLREMVLGEFGFDEPTRIYRPGATISTRVVVENRSRTESLRLNAELAWLRPDGSELKTQRNLVNLPPGGNDYRSRQPIDFSLKIDQPGLYHLVARVRASGWTEPTIFETTIAVTPNNRDLPRGRSTFFAVRTNLMSEPVADQLLEISVARDLGVHVLALDTPWNRLEPAPGRFDFSALERLVDALVSRDILPLLVLTDPPPDARPESLGGLLDALVGQFGEKVPYYQMSRAALGLEPDADPAAPLVKLAERLANLKAGIALISPPLPSVPGTTVGPANLIWCVSSAGDARRAAAGLPPPLESRDAPRPQWWLSHVAEPLQATGFAYDAEALLHYHVRAASAGVPTVLWFDLRDDNVDPRDAGGGNGLVQRDFSPKASLLGYTAAVRALGGLRFAGPVHGAPGSFDSALFTGADRQVAVLLPRPNRIGPALLAPIQGVPGEIRVRDANMTEVPRLTAVGPALYPLHSGPTFVTLKLASAQPEPQLALAPPWISVPARLFAGAEARCAIDVTAPTPFRSGFLQFVLAPDAPLTATPNAKALKSTPGETQRIEMALAAKPDAGVTRAAATVRLALDGKNVDTPVEVVPIVAVSPLSSAAELASAGAKIGALTAVDGGRATAHADLHAGYDAATFQLLVALHDDDLVSRPAVEHAADGLRVGVAAEGASRHLELAVDLEQAALHGLSGTDPDDMAGCRVEWTDGSGGKKLARLTIPARALGVEALAAGQRLLVAARYADAPASTGPVRVLQWGVGLDGRRSSSDFNWVVLVPARN